MNTLSVNTVLGIHYTTSVYTEIALFTDNSALCLSALLFIIDECDIIKSIPSSHRLTKKLLNVFLIIICHLHIPHVDIFVLHLFHLPSDVSV